MTLDRTAVDYVIIKKFLKPFSSTPPPVSSLSLARMVPRMMLRRTWICLRVWESRHAVGQNELRLCIQALLTGERFSWKLAAQERASWIICQSEEPCSSASVCLWVGSTDDSGDWTFTFTQRCWFIVRGHVGSTGAVCHPTSGQYLWMGLVPPNQHTGWSQLAEDHISEIYWPRVHFLPVPRTKYTSGTPHTVWRWSPELWRSSACCGCTC